MGKKVEAEESVELAKNVEAMQQEAAVVKAAKKFLKKNDNPQMKMKALVQLVRERVPGVSSEQAKSWIQQSSKFELDRKKVSLKRKRSKVEDSSSDEQRSESKSNKKSKTNADKSKVEEKVSSVSTDGSTENIAEWREKQKIVLMSSTPELTTHANNDKQYFPFCTFDDCKGSISPLLVQQCTKGNGFEYPSPIQSQAWPVLTEKNDIVGIAETGSGKTLAFALPALTQLSSQPKGSNKSSRWPRMLVLAPTRELAMQSDEVLQEFGAVVSLKSLVVYGGVPKHQQTSALKQGVDCLVATPGRLKDLIQEGFCSLENIQFLVLDEADRMLDLGFEEDVRFIISQCPSQDKGRQTAMFSATWPAVIQKIAMDFMNKDPLRVYVGFERINSGEEEGGANPSSVDDSLSANKRVKQIVEVVDDMKRPSRLRQILNQVHKAQKDRVLLFCLYKKEAERMEYSLQREGWKCCSIHGNKHQQARTAALQDFKDGTCPLMIATDVAARGLDIPNVQVVINYTFPLTIEDYVHRIGRTGRAGQTGVSYTFFQPTADKAHAGSLQHVLRQAQQDIPEDLKKFGSTIKKKEHKLYGNFGPRDGIPMKQATKITFESDDED